MAGLLDMFGSSWDDPRSSAMLALAGGLLSANGSQGLGAGLVGANNAMQQAREAEARKRMQDLQEQQIRMAMAEKQAAIAKQQQLQQLASKYFTPEVVAQGGTGALQGAMGEYSIGAMPPIPGKPAGFDLSGYAQALAGAGQIPEYLAIRKEVQGESPLGKADPKDYTPASVAKFAMTRNYGDLVRLDKAHMADSGGKIIPLDAFTGQPLNAGIDKTATPDAFMTDARERANQAVMRQQGWANIGIARDRLNKDAENMISDAGGASQAAFNKQFGKPSPGYRWKADGSQEFIPGGPADQKAQLKTVGEGTVDGVVADIRDKFNQLKAGGGVTDTTVGAMDNLGAAVGSSGVGQLVGRAIGSQNQSMRNNILMARPLLLQAIMKATGMSAKQMDSNAELKLYLSTATDPTLDIQANMAALDRIEKMYGSGGKNDPAKPTPLRQPTLRYNPQTGKLEQVQ